MRVEAGIAQFGDLLRQKFDSVRGVTEDDRLVDLKFLEEGVETVNFLAFVHECVVLSDTT